MFFCFSLDLRQPLAPSLSNVFWSPLTVLRLYLVFYSMHFRYRSTCVTLELLGNPRRQSHKPSEHTKVKRKVSSVTTQAGFLFG